MRIPPYYRQPGWQRFFAGALIGGVISWTIFLFMFGVLQEKQTATIEKQRDRISDLNQGISHWQEEFKLLNKKNSELLTVQDIKLKIVNAKEYRIEDSLSIFEAEEEIKGDLSPLLAKDLDSVYKNKELIKKTIENKTLKINDKRYKVKVKEIYFFTVIQVFLELEYEG
ncbi:sporulation membrane protein YtrI [Bacillus sp. AK031]